jgi:hypothetical protein
VRWCAAIQETGKIGASKPKSKEKAIKQATAIALAEAGKSRKGNRPVKIY